MKLMKKILERSKQNKELVGIWEYDEEDTFWCGYVLDYNDEMVKIKKYSEYGKPNGVLIEKLSNIENIEFESDYMVAMQYLIDHVEVLDDDKEIDVELNEEKSLTESILKNLEGRKDIVASFRMGDSFYSGFVVNVSDSDFMLHCIAKMGEDDGCTIYKIKEIEAFKINDIEHRKRLMLYNWRNNK